MSLGQLYKVKLVSGRILGPLDLDRIRLLILKNQITGKEHARVHPQGEWQDINQIGAIAELLVAKILGQLKAEEPSDSDEDNFYRPILGQNITQGETVVLSSPSSNESATETAVLESPTVSTSDSGLELEPAGESKADHPLTEKPAASFSDEPEKTMIADPSEFEVRPANSFSESASDGEKTMVGMAPGVPEEAPGQDSSSQAGGGIQLDSVLGSIPGFSEFVEAAPEQKKEKFSEQRTVIFQRPQTKIDLPRKQLGGIPGRGGPQAAKKGSSFQRLFVILAILGVAMEVLLPDGGAKKKPAAVVHISPIRPQLPVYVAGQANPQQSIELYNGAVKFYLEDTVEGYRQAAQNFKKSAELDPGNVKAVAMLASSYINLIDSSNKDESYFEILAKLIDLSRAKNIDLPETVIADVEYFLIANRGEAAQNRIIEYTKAHADYGIEMFYYLALAFFHRGDLNTALNFINQIPDDKTFSAKTIFLKGKIAEKLNDTDLALRTYGQALKFNAKHAKSRLRLAALANSRGMLKDAEPELDFLLQHPELMTPGELAQTYYLHGLLAELQQKWDVGLADLERAVKLDPDNHDFLLELYTLRGKAGESTEVVRKFARMYFFLGEGEKLIQQGKYEDALVPLLQARQTNPESPLPLVKIGEMFTYLHDLENAKLNYKLATERAPNNIQVWSKYIQTLIQTYEWEEATKAMDRFRSLPVSQSAIDKSAADIYQKQGRYTEAQAYYRKAMARDTIDPDVYLAYGKSLMSTKDYKNAPFFFAIALRYDPLNLDAIILTAKCAAETDSVGRGISMLQDAMKERNSSQAEFLGAIADLQIQKGDWEGAQKSVDEALRVNPDSSYSYFLKGQIYLSRESTDKSALNKALEAFKSYSDRNASDPSGYLERYKIYAKLAQYDKAYDELKRIFEIYPKYPQLHYYTGALFAVQGNHRMAIEEFQKELANNPISVQTLIALGRELLENGNAQDALVQFTKAMRLAPSSSEAKHYAGWANRALKNYDASTALIQAAIALDQGNPLLYKRLALVYREAGSLYNACGAFRKYLLMEPDAPDRGEFPQCR